MHRCVAANAIHNVVLMHKTERMLTQVLNDAGQPTLHNIRRKATMNQLLLLSVHIRRVYIQLHQSAEPLTILEDIRDSELISPSAPAALVSTVALAHKYI